MPSDNPPPRPVQVFLDTKRFIDIDEPREFGGGQHDFFKGNDRGFRVHKQRIRDQIRSAAAVMRKSDEPAAFLHVQVREEALGKSYRPIKSLFSDSQGFALVGAGRIGEMVFQATPERLERLDRIIEEKAEDTPRNAINKKTGLPELRVSSYRSEVGAIAGIAPHEALDRVQFSAEEAVDWFQQGNVIGGYVVELFRPYREKSPAAIAALVKRLEEALNRIPSGISVRPFLPKEGASRFGLPPLAITIQLHRSSEREINLPFVAGGQPLVEQASRPRPPARQLDLDVTHHRALLELLSEQTLVRSVELPPLVEAAPASMPVTVDLPTVPLPTPQRSYPVVGIVDGGVADIRELTPWRIGDAGLVPPVDRDESHGTFIAGLVVAGGLLNPHIANRVEPYPCKFYDLDLFPRPGLRQQYFGGDIDYFFDLLDEKVKAAKQAHGVRIFNLSFGVRASLGRFTYTPFADRLDRLARANDVIFVISAGNLASTDTRPPWSMNAGNVITMLATFGADAQRIVPPAENLLGITVGAINPPGVRGHDPDVPTTYTRRGPGIGGSRKPDVAHYGGVSASSASGNRTGLASFAPNGDVVENSGTSFAAPHMSATLATLDHRLEHGQPREVIMALPIHRAARCKALSHASLRHISREFVGFGLPPSCDELLMDGPYAISLIFTETLLRRQKLEFPFAWPAGLVSTTGACRGKVDLTLAYTPPIDPDHKDEAQRVQLDAHLRQETVDDETGEVTWPGQLKQDGSGIPEGMNATERYLLKTGLKWSPIKRYSAGMIKGRGTSSNWRLTLESLTRAGAQYPAEGVPFALILTISDSKRLAPIHDDVRNTLRTQGFVVADITVAHRVRQRTD